MVAFLGISAICLTRQDSQSKKVSVPFASDIARFKAEDKKNPPEPGQILFIGSSSFTRWTDVSNYFPNYKILNRAFGGSTFVDQIRWVNDVVFPYHPKQIVLYCGENDFANDQKLAAYKNFDRFVELFQDIRSRLPNVPIVFISMKPSPSRWFMRSKFIAANQWIADYCIHQKATTFVNVWDTMLDSEGHPRAGIFVADKLHMNADGYRLWQPLIEPTLLK